MKKLITLTIFLLSLGLVSAVNAKTCELEIDSNDQMQFDKKEMTIAADCTEVKLTLTHSGTMAANVMGHNWVLTQTNDMQAVATAGMSTGLENDYVPEDLTDVIAYTKIIGGGESTSITFDVTELSKDVNYSFFCSFPGHWGVMKGKFIVE
ncbi:MAG: azurin [Proteobacteria bacterium]|nr:MAG: azurin [Pseudomonadota bacterium]